MGINEWAGKWGGGPEWGCIIVFPFPKRGIFIHQKRMGNICGVSVEKR